MVHAVDGHSNKSALLPPTSDELDRLAQRSRVTHPGAALRKTASAPVRSLRRRLPPHAVKELVARYNAGEDTPALSREFCISKTALCDLLRAEGVSMRAKAITLEDTERAVQLYESGLTINQVVHRIGYSYGTVRRVLHERGVAMRVNGLAPREAVEGKPKRAKDGGVSA